MSWMIVDIEASGPGASGYPIEIAWAVVGIPRGTAALIRPSPEWKTPGSWNSRSQDIHGIGPDMLERDGIDSDRVSDAFLSAATGCRILSDMPCADGPWLARLTGTRPSLLDFWEQARIHGKRSREAAAVEEVDHVFPARHRAAADVRRLMFLWERIVGS